MTCEYTLYAIYFTFIFYTANKSPTNHNVLNTLSTSSYCSCVVLTGCICLCSIVAGPLKKPPGLLEFLSQVASKARDKWKMIGLVLNMPDLTNAFDSIKNYIVNFKSDYA